MRVTAKLPKKCGKMPHSARCPMRRSRALWTSLWSSPEASPGLPGSTVLHEDRAWPSSGSSGQVRIGLVDCLMEYSGVRRLGSFCKSSKGWSGGRGSNPRRPAWEAGILPLNYPRTSVNISLSTSSEQPWRDCASQRQSIPHQGRRNEH